MPLPYIEDTIEDQSTRVSTTTTNNIGLVIAAKKGPINTPTKVSGQTDFLRKFTPNERIEIGWDSAYWEAYQYLKTQAGLYVVRAAHTEDSSTDDDDYPVLYGGLILKDSTSDNDNIALEEGFSDPEAYIFQDDDVCLIYGSDPGAYNNDISIIVVTDQAKVKLEGAFILKIYKKNVLVETYTCSFNPSLKDGYGNSVYIETVLDSSIYVSALSNAVEGDDGYPTPKAQETALNLAGGDDGSDVTDADRIIALNTFRNASTSTVKLILDGGNTTTAYHQAIADICDYRNDACHGIISTRYVDEVNADPRTAVLTYRNDTLNMNNYSMEMYTPHQQIYDEFNDRYIWISPGSFVAALSIKYANSLGWHWAVAGYTRGIVPSLDVAVDYETDTADEFSDAQINTIMKESGYGNIIMDEQTLYATACDLQDAHISRYLNIYLRPAIKELLRSYLFEFNDEETRLAITEKIKTFMNPEQSGRAVYDYYVVCDETNNTDSDIENNILNVWLYVKPTKIAKFIKQKVIVTPYSVDLASLGEE